MEILWALFADNSVYKRIWAAGDCYCYNAGVEMEDVEGAEEVVGVFGVDNYWASLRRIPLQGQMRPVKQPV